MWTLLVTIIRYNAVWCILVYCWFVKDSVSEPEEFTVELQKVLKSSPQPYLVPFLKVGNVKYCTTALSLALHVCRPVCVWLGIKALEFHPANWSLREDVKVHESLALPWRASGHNCFRAPEMSHIACGHEEVHSVERSHCHKPHVGMWIYGKLKML